MTSNYPNPGSDPHSPKGLTDSPDSVSDPRPAPLPMPDPTPDPDPTPIPSVPDPNPDIVHRVEVNKEGDLETKTTTFHQEENVGNRINIKRTAEDRTKETIAPDPSSGLAKVATYGLLIIGLLMIVFSNIFGGGLLVGLVGGYHFAPEIAFYLRNIHNIFSTQGQLRAVALAGLILGFLLTTPGIVIGAVIAAAVAHMINGETLA